MSRSTPERGLGLAARSGAEFVEAVLGLLETRGLARYEEDVTQLEHAVQTASLARAAGGSDALVCAALLHDFGHLVLGEHEAAATPARRDLRHEDVGARLLARWFPPEVCEPIRLHVVAKRYLCTVDPDYAGELSAASTRSLALQGGPLDDGARRELEAAPHFDDAVRLRRWDDAGKRPGARAPDPRSFTGLLVGALRGRPIAPPAGNLGPRPPIW